MKNPTFYDTIIHSKHWKKWEEEQERRQNPEGNWEGTFDYVETRETGFISPEHFDSFMDFHRKKR